jgi:DNA-binding response OmpR family regulator
MTPARVILLIEPDAAIRAALREQLALLPDITVRTQPDDATALGADGGGFDLLILAVTREDDLAPALDSEIPATLLLADRADDALLDAALASGADDVLVKPFRLAPFLAHVRRLLRDGDGETPIQLGGFLFRPGRRLLDHADPARRVRLTEKEAAILRRLARAPAPVERQTLLHEIWGYDERISTHTLETHIYKLRQKLEPNPSEARFLLTEGGGYRLDPLGGATSGVTPAP